VLVGLLIGGLSALLTLSVYAAQDAFQQLLQGSVSTHAILAGCGECQECEFVT
jgi:hypothetical protein